MKNVANTIERLREEAELSLTELSKRTGLSQAYLSKLESGVYKSLSLHRCKQLADGLNMTLHSLLQELGYLEQRERPSSKLILQALRRNGYNKEQIDNLMSYAKYLKNKQ